MNTKALREQRKKLAEDANAILAAAVAEGRAASPDEISRVDAMHADIDALKATIDRAERASDEVSSIVPESQGRRTGSEDESNDKQAAEAAFRKWAVDGMGSLSSDEVRALGGVKPSGNGTEVTMSFGTRVAQTVTTTGGGYAIAPAFSEQLEKSLLHFGGMLKESDVITTATGAAMTWPTYDDTSNTGAILAINTAITDVALTFGAMTLDAYKYTSKSILVPVELMQDSAFDINAVVADALGERLGRILNTHFTTGTGLGQPNGVVTASSAGKTGASGQTATVVYADLIDLIHSVDIAYRSKAKFMMNDASVKVLRKLVDGDSRPLWQPGLNAGSPDSLLGFPVVVNNDVAVMAASARSILFGDFSKYKIRRVKDITLLRLNERYADLHQVGFVAFARFDGDLLDAGTDPVKHYINAAS